MTHAGPRTSRILIATDSPVEGQEIEAMLHGQRLGPVRVTSDSREIPALLDKWPYRFLILDSAIGPRPAQDVLDGLAAPIRARRLGVLALMQSHDAVGLARLCAGLNVDVLYGPYGRLDVVMRVRWGLAALDRAAAE